jgi:hypothetical protein
MYRNVDVFRFDTLRYKRSDAGAILRRVLLFAETIRQRKRIVSDCIQAA